MQKKFSLHPLIFYSLAIVASLMILTFALYTPDFSFYLPRKYSHDALFSGAMVKTVIDTGWYLTNPYLSAPSIYHLADYPMAESLSFFIIKCLAWFSHDYSLVMNLFYFLTFPITTIVTLFIFERLGLNRTFALSAALLYTFLPYHFYRNESHLLLNTYYVVPIYIYLALQIFSREKLSRKKYFLYALACIIAASSGIYYAFFACYLFLVAGMLASLDIKKWSPLYTSFFLILITAVTTIANVSPTLIAQFRYGKNTEIANRSPAESEVAGLKIAQLMLPVDGHRVHPFKILKARYEQTAPLVNENSSATLGIIGDIGFVILIALVFLQRSQQQPKMLFQLARLNLAALLLATIGGFSAVFAYLVSPTIRSYNRISVFIAFFALYAFFLLLQKIFHERYQKQTVRYFIYALIILLIGLADQIPSKTIHPNYAAIKTEFNADQQFVAEIEKRLPNNSMVFQFPVMPFPENPVINEMTDYELFKGYLHSKALRWSYGAIRGRETIAWQLHVQELPIEKMLHELIRAGFVGLEMDLKGYGDVQRQFLLKKLTKILRVEPLYDERQNFVFYDLRQFIRMSHS